MYIPCYCSCRAKIPSLRLGSAHLIFARPGHPSRTPLSSFISSNASACRTDNSSYSHIILRQQNFDITRTTNRRNRGTGLSGGPVRTSNIHFIISQVELTAIRCHKNAPWKYPHRSRNGCGMRCGTGTPPTRRKPPCLIQNRCISEYGFSSIAR
jgi:hypothetical protein